MAVVSIMKMQGDPDELSDTLGRMTQLAEEKAKQYGGIATIMARTDDGLMIINLWETEEGRHRMADDPDMRASMQTQGFTPNFTAYEVLDYRIA